MPVVQRSEAAVKLRESILLAGGANTAMRCGDALCIDTTAPTRCDIPRELMHRMRSSVIFLGPMLARFGEAEVTVTLDYNSSDEDGNETNSGTLVLHLSRNPEELAAYEEALSNEEDELPDVTCYARVGESQIVYLLTQTEYDALTAVSYDTLRHQTLFTADFDAVTSIDAALEGKTFTFTRTLPEDGDDEDAEGVWTYNGEAFDVYALKAALCAVSASGFTEEAPTGQEEISLTVHMDNEDFPTLTLTLYRYDGANCIAAMDGQTAAFVSRSQTVALIEAVNALTLNS